MDRTVRFDPDYPGAPIRERITVLDLLINSAGKVDEARIVSDAPDLAANIEKAVAASCPRPPRNSHPTSSGGPYYQYPPSGSAAGQTTLTTAAAPRQVLRERESAEKSQP